MVKNVGKISGEGKDGGGNQQGKGMNKNDVNQERIEKLWKEKREFCNRQN